MKKVITISLIGIILSGGAIAASKEDIQTYLNNTTRECKEYGNDVAYDANWKSFSSFENTGPTFSKLATVWSNICSNHKTDKSFGTKFNKVVFVNSSVIKKEGEYSLSANGKTLEMTANFDIFRNSSADTKVGDQVDSLLKK
jgi:hypothetical protein